MSGFVPPVPWLTTIIAVAWKRYWRPSERTVPRLGKLCPERPTRRPYQQRMCVKELRYTQCDLLIIPRNTAAPAIPTIIPDVTDTEEGLAKAQKAMEKLYGELNYTSVTIAALSNEARADIVFSPTPAYSEVKSRPLRLLSCGTHSTPL